MPRWWFTYFWPLDNATVMVHVLLAFGPDASKAFQSCASRKFWRQAIHFWYHWNAWGFLPGRLTWLHPTSQCEGEGMKSEAECISCFESKRKHKGQTRVCSGIDLQAWLLLSSGRDLTWFGQCCQLAWDHEPFCCTFLWREFLGQRHWAFSSFSPDRSLPLQ